MAGDGIQITDRDTGAPAAAPEAGSQQQQPLGTGASQGLQLTDLINRIGRQSEMGHEDLKYVEDLTNILKKDREVGSSIVVAPVDDRLLDIYRVTLGKNSIMLLFSTTYTIPSDTHIPPTDGIAAAAATCKEDTGGRVINTIVVNPADYTEVNRMAISLISTLRVATGNIGTVTLNSLNNGQYHVSTTISDVRDAIRKMNPKAVMPRTDIGLVLYAKEDVGLNNQNPVKKTTPVLVIGGYTEIVSNAGAPNSYQLGAANPSFIPVVTITSILSPLMQREMLSLAIPLATDEFIRRNGWLRPYTTFAKDRANLGSLMPDAKGKPYFIDSQPKLMDFIQKNMSRPWLAIDVTEGMPRIPGIESLVYDDNGIQEGIAKFLGVPNNETAGTLVLDRFKFYIGEIDGDLDSREIDYLTLVSKGVDDMNLLLRYLYIGGEPHIRASLISKVYDMKALYTNVRCILDSKYIDNLSSRVAQQFRPLWENSNIPENNIGVLATGNGNEFNQGPSFGMGHVQTGWGARANPYSM